MAVPFSYTTLRSYPSELLDLCVSAHFWSAGWCYPIARFPFAFLRSSFLHISADVLKLLALALRPWSSVQTVPNAFSGLSGIGKCLSSDLGEPGGVRWAIWVDCCSQHPGRNLFSVSPGLAVGYSPYPWNQVALVKVWSARFTCSFALWDTDPAINRCCGLTWLRLTLSSCVYYAFLTGTFLRLFQTVTSNRPDPFPSILR